jgi:hypothetical protein
MLDYLEDLWARLQVRWHVLLVALAAAAPEILQYLGVIDLQPILSQFLPDNYVKLIVGIMPFALMFLKSAFSVEPKEAEDE